MRTLATTRLTLEPQVAAHADALFSVLSDAALYEYENEPPSSSAWLRARLTRLESRSSTDGREQWLNWVVRLRTTELIGYVQATVHPERCAGIAYVLSSAFWGRGLASEAVSAMIAELAESYDVQRLFAVLKAGNFRSRHLLERLGFVLTTPGEHGRPAVENGEILMCGQANSQNLSPVVATHRG